MRYVFVQSREEYKNEQSRNTYMSQILNNLGLGQGIATKTADQV